MEINRLMKYFVQFVKTKLLWDIVHTPTCMPTLSGEPQGRHVVIVDDLVQTGGTLIQCAKVRWSRLPSLLLSVLCILHVTNVWLSVCNN